MYNVPKTINLAEGNLHLRQQKDVVRVLIQFK